MMRKVQCGILAVFLVLTIKETRSMEVDKNGDTSLHLAVSRNNPQDIQRLLKQGVDINAKNEGGLCPLHIAAREGFIEPFRILLGHNADMRAQDATGQTVLHLAALHGHLIIIQELIKQTDKVKIKEIINVQSHNGSTALHLAAVGGHDNIVTIFINSDAILDIADMDGQTPLHMAALNGREQIVSLLSSRKTRVDINKQDKRGNTALHLAVNKGDDDISRTLVNLGVKVNIANREGKTPLNLAHNEKHISLAAFLRDHGAFTSEYFNEKNLGFIRAVKNDAVETLEALLENENSPYTIKVVHPHINAQDEEGDTLLHIAVRNNNKKMVEKLIDGGAEINISNHKGETALDLAQKESYLEGLLVGKGAKRGQDSEVQKQREESEEESDASPLHKAVMNGTVEEVENLVRRYDINAQDSNGWTPLFLAVDCGNINVVKKLILLGAHLDIADKTGRTLLHRAAFRGYPKIINLLIGKGIDVNKRNNDGETALHVALRNNHVNAITALLKSPKIDTGIQDNKSQTPLDLAKQKDSVVQKIFQRHETRKLARGSSIIGAIRRRGRKALKQEIDLSTLNNKEAASVYRAVGEGKAEEVRKLIKRRASSVNIRQKDDWTPLHLACDEGYLEIVNDLIEAGADVNAESKEKWTPLHIASQAGYEKIVKALIEAGANVDAKNKYGWTPLLLAADEGKSSVITELITAGATVNVKTESSNRTPLQVACKAGHKAIVEILLTGGADVNARNTNGDAASDLAAQEGYTEIVEMLRAAVDVEQKVIL